MTITMVMAVTMVGIMRVSVGMRRIGARAIEVVVVCVQI